MKSVAPILISVSLLLLGCNNHDILTEPPATTQEHKSEPESLEIEVVKAEGVTAASTNTQRRDSSVSAFNTLGWTYLSQEEVTPKIKGNIVTQIQQCGYKPEGELADIEFIKSSICMENAGYHHTDRMEGVCDVPKYSDTEVCKQHIYDLYESGI